MNTERSNIFRFYLVQLSYYIVVPRIQPHALSSLIFYINGKFTAQRPTWALTGPFAAKQWVLLQNNSRPTRFLIHGDSWEPNHRHHCSTCFCITDPEILSSPPVKQVTQRSVRQKPQSCTVALVCRFLHALSRGSSSVR